MDDFDEDALDELRHNLSLGPDPGDEDNLHEELSFDPFEVSIYSSRIELNLGDSSVEIGRGKPDNFWNVFERLIYGEELMPAIQREQRGSLRTSGKVAATRLEAFTGESGGLPEELREPAEDLYFELADFGIFNPFSIGVETIEERASTYDLMSYEDGKNGVSNLEVWTNVARLESSDDMEVAEAMDDKIENISDSLTSLREEGFIDEDNQLLPKSDAFGEAVSELFDLRLSKRDAEEYTGIDSDAFGNLPQSQKAEVLRNKVWDEIAVDLGFLDKSNPSDLILFKYKLQNRGYSPAELSEYISNRVPRMEEYLSTGDFEKTLSEIRSKYEDWKNEGILSPKNLPTKKARELNEFDENYNEELMKIRTL